MGVGVLLSFFPIFPAIFPLQVFLLSFFSSHQVLPVKELPRGVEPSHSSGNVLQIHFGGEGEESCEG